MSVLLFWRRILIYTDFTEYSATDVYLEVTRSQTYFTRILYRVLYTHNSLVFNGTGIVIVHEI